LKNLVLPIHPCEAELKAREMQGKTLVLLTGLWRPARSRRAYSVRKESLPGGR
jgi:hypothetical protein